MTGAEDADPPGGAAAGSSPAPEKSDLDLEGPPAELAELTWLLRRLAAGVLAAMAAAADATVPAAAASDAIGVPDGDWRPVPAAASPGRSLDPEDPWEEERRRLQGTPKTRNWSFTTEMLDILLPPIRPPGDRFLP